MGTIFGGQKNYGFISLFINHVKEWKSDINISTKTKIIWGGGGFILGIIASLIANFIFEILK
jgi:hypothetical protein